MFNVIEVRMVQSKLMGALGLSGLGIVYVAERPVNVVCTAEQLERQIVYHIFPGRFRPRDVARMVATLGQRLPDAIEVVGQRLAQFPDPSPELEAEYLSISEKGDLILRHPQSTEALIIESVESAIITIAYFVEEGHLDPTKGAMLTKRMMIILRLQQQAAMEAQLFRVLVSALFEHYPDARQVTLVHF